MSEDRLVHENEFGIFNPCTAEIVWKAGKKPLPHKMNWVSSYLKRISKEYYFPFYWRETIDNACK
jgi:hypothetical protein|tara:strand:+ start:815 stop:1009 length:195 start_codon:yes stop_codon:yes gene_type:complete